MDASKPGTPTSPRGMGEILGVLVAVAVVSLSVAIAAWILQTDDGVESTPLPAETSVITSGPTATSPLLQDPEALMLARSSGPVLVGLAAASGGPVDVFVFEEEERALREGVVSVSVDGSPARVLERGTCGKGCFRLDAVALSGSPLELEVAVERPDKEIETVDFQLPALMPPSGADLFERVQRTMAGLRSVRIDETLSTGLASVRSEWEILAPDRVSLESSDGGKTILIGDRRWDVIDGDWLESPGELEQQPWYPFEDGRNARILGERTFGGVEVTRLAVFTSEPELWWFVLDVAPDGRVLRERMLAPSHFMVDVFSRFNEPVSIEAPS
jgi:hypothetical protein